MRDDRNLNSGFGTRDSGLEIRQRGCTVENSTMFSLIDLLDNIFRSPSPESRVPSPVQ
jgi:hypothetical protein